MSYNNISWDCLSEFESLKMNGCNLQLTLIFSYFLRQIFEIYEVLVAVFNNFEVGVCLFLQFSLFGNIVKERKLVQLFEPFCFLSLLKIVLHHPHFVCDL